jgi:hypothetical protein
LRADDFRLRGRSPAGDNFSAERVPVSLGTLDTSGSMGGEKIQAAQSAPDRFPFDLDKQDDLSSLQQRSRAAAVVTTDRPLLSRALGRIVPNGARAMMTRSPRPYAAQRGQHMKKALLGSPTATTPRAGQHRRVAAYS